MSDRPSHPRPRRYGTVIALLLLAFAILALLTWQRWSANAISSINDSEGTVVQPAEVPPPGGAVRARPNNNGTDPSGDAVASPGERRSESR